MVRPFNFKLNRTVAIRALTLTHDIVASVVALIAGLYIRLGTEAWSIVASEAFLGSVAFFAVLMGVVSVAFGLHRGLWRYASIPDLLAIVKSASIGVLGYLLYMFMVSRLEAIPRTSLVIIWALMVLGMGGTRVAYRLWRNRRVRRLRFRSDQHTVILVGADGGSELFIKAVSERPRMDFSIAAVLDDRNRRAGMRIRGVPVIGRLEQLEPIVARFEAEGRPVASLILTKHQGTFEPGSLDRIIEWSADHGFSLQQAPDVQDMSERSTGSIETRPLRISDLLGRPSASLDTDALSTMLREMTVLVTGAGGTIGSELCRQIARRGPKRMIIVEINELNLYEIDRDLRRIAPDVQTVSLLGDVRDRQEMSGLFAVWRPDLVFHAAALKHVPIVENQPLAGLETNVIGTRNIADAARHNGAHAMVLISTDKAVNPTSVMGGSKRMAEIYCQSLDLNCETRFVAVRFGNVLGSSGSVVPLFEQQIKAGGPVTVTHPEISRFFMTIPEASQLVLHAMQVALGTERYRGHVHVLDMGQPVKILGLARRMIMLSGLRPDVDIPIVFTGLRPGEKLHEELFSERDNPVGTGHKGVLVGTPPSLTQEEAAALIHDLERAIEARDVDAAIAVLKRAVPEIELEGPRTSQVAAVTSTVR